MCLGKDLLASARSQGRMLLTPELMGEEEGAPVNSLRVIRRTIPSTLQYSIFGEFEGPFVQTAHLNLHLRTKRPSHIHKKGPRQLLGNFIKHSICSQSLTACETKTASCEQILRNSARKQTIKKAQLFVGDGENNQNRWILWMQNQCQKMLIKMHGNP